MLPQAVRSVYYQQLLKAEENARASKKRIWESYVEPKEENEEGEEGEEEQIETENKVPNEVDSQSTAAQERKQDYRKVFLFSLKRISQLLLLGGFCYDNNMFFF